VAQTAKGAVEIPGILNLGRTDPVGAGDTFLSGLGAALAVNAAPEEAAQLGNFAAAVVVTKIRRTGAASPAEILAIGREPQYVCEPERADDPRRTRALPP
jgi:sugar/nucleoside kinase (ribokinase family)